MRRGRRIDSLGLFGSAAEFPAWMLAGRGPPDAFLHSLGPESRTGPRTRSRAAGRRSGSRSGSRTARTPRVRKTPRTAAGTPLTAPVMAEATQLLHESYAALESPEVARLYDRAMLQTAKRSANHDALLGYKAKVTRDIMQATTVEQILQKLVVQGRTQWVGRGQFGETLMVQWKGVPVPMIMKLMGQRPPLGCLPATALTPPHTLCKDILPGSSTFDWAPPFLPAWEQANYEVLSGLSVDLGATPNLPFVYFAGVVKLPPKQAVSLVDLIRDPRNHVGNTSRMKSPPRGSNALVPQRSLAIVLMEYVGQNLDPVTRDLLSRVAMRPVAIQMIRSVLCQVLHGLLTMRVVGMRHNDLHSNNVMGMPTPATHLLYILDDVPPSGKGDNTVRVFRVPTLGMVWRIIDFGGSSTVEASGSTGVGPYQFGHGLMARFFYAGPTHPDVQDSRVKAAPLETFDIFRLASTLIAPSRTGRTPGEALLTRMVTTAKAMAGLTPARRAYAMSVGKVGTMRLPPVTMLASAQATDRVLQEVVALSRASEDTGILWDLFQWLAEDSGYSVPADRVSQQVRPTDDGPFFVSRFHPDPHPDPAPTPSAEDVRRIVSAVHAMIRRH
jgi:hypothetical protein